MSHEVARHLVEASLRGEDVIVALQVLLQALLNVDVVDGQIAQPVGDALVQVADGEAQPVAAGLVVQGHGGLILHGPLEVVGRDVLAKTRLVIWSSVNRGVPVKPM